VTTLLVLCAIDPEQPDRRCVGQSRFLGEAGLILAQRGIRLICAEPGAASGWQPVPRTWEPVDVTGVRGVYDRHHDPDRDVQRAWAKRGVPVVNAAAFSSLCDDKLAWASFARHEGLPAPRTLPATDDGWRDWPAPYHKPRTGRGGTGVSRLAPGDLPGSGIVQQALEARVAGETIRVLMQRSPTRPWFVAGAMRRVAPPGEPVSSLARGAAATPLSAADAASLTPLLEALGDRLDTRPGATHVVETGIDLVLTRSGPQVLEINARPGRSFDRIGRTDLRSEALMHPFDALLALID
jgi:glutathione synthase/RimK-type ligase-like ATP-grasp enzyme